MRERLEKFIKMEGLTPSRFAEIMAVQPSSISHLLGGRNKPSYDFIEKILLRFPKLSPDWLILGKGTMYRSPEPGPTPDKGSGSMSTSGNFSFAPPFEEELDELPTFDFTIPASQIQSPELYTDNTAPETERRSAPNNTSQRPAPIHTSENNNSQPPQNAAFQADPQVAPIQRILEEFNGNDIERIVVFLKNKTFVDYKPS